ncbi:hypothetical protein AD998_20825 [bacterium 336/3]|nr:hypothetical protein AD998_20825 [bacterium 336/3]
MSLSKISNIPIRIGETIKGDDILEKDELLDIDRNVTNTIKGSAILSENGSDDIENILTIGRLIDEATTFKGTGHLLFCFSPLFLLG